MVTRMLVICIGILLRVNLSYSASKSQCEHQTTLPIDYDNKAKQSDIVIEHNSGKIFEVIKNQCLDIILPNVSPRFIWCKTKNQYLDNSSSAEIQLRNITDTMDGVFRCDLFLENVTIILQFELKVKDARQINVEVNNMQLHFKATNLTTEKYDGIAVYEFEKDAYIDLVCSNLNNFSIEPIIQIYTNPGHRHSLETRSFGAAVRATGWLTADDENNVYIDCISQSNTNELRKFIYRITFKLKQTRKSDTIKNPIIVYVNDEPYKSMDLKDTKLQYKYRFDYMENINVSCIRKYKTGGQLTFSYYWRMSVAPNAPGTKNNNDMTIVQHTSAKAILVIKGNTLNYEQKVTCRINNDPSVQAEIILIPKPGVRQRVCSMPVDIRLCNHFTVKWYFNVKDGVCSWFHYGGCEGNGNQFTSEKECKAICVNPSLEDACWLPKIKGPCGSTDLRWYFDTTMKQCMAFEYGGCSGNTNNFVTKELCERQCDSNKTVETTTENTGEESTFDEDIERTTSLPADDDAGEHTRNQTENYARDEGHKDTTKERKQDVETGVSSVVIACVAVIAVIIVTGSVAFWYRRKKNMDTSRNESTNQAQDNVHTTPEPQNPLASDSSAARYEYDYAYNINIERLFTSSRPPDPCRRIKPKVGNQQDQRRNSNDSSSSESNYYCEIDEYFINKREAKREQKQQKKNLLKK